MKQSLVLALLAVSTFFYFHNSTSSTSAVGKTASTQPINNTVVVAAQSSYNRWKTGPNAQTDFEPFAPNEQATWNQTPGYTIVAGPRVR